MKLACIFSFYFCLSWFRWNLLVFFIIYFFSWFRWNLLVNHFIFSVLACFEVFRNFRRKGDGKMALVVLPNGGACHKMAT